MQRLWYGRRLNPAALALLPAAWLFRVAVSLRRHAFRRGWLSSHAVPVPVVVIGNITVGGAGKTPLTLWVIERLRHAGLRPGVVSRGYGRSAKAPQAVSAGSSAAEVGDEPVLLAQRSGCPMVVGADRVAAIGQLLEVADVDVVICDDGLQHYRLRRDVEIVVVDGRRGLGNGRLLPAGPLREPSSRLREADVVIYNGGGHAGQRMRLLPDAAQSLADPSRTRPLSAFSGTECHAVAGIGDPQRFFDMLTGFGLRIIPHAFADHHPYQGSDIDFGDDRPVLMTEKDAVKCRAFAGQNHWFIPVTAELETLAGKSVCKALQDGLQPAMGAAARTIMDGIPRAEWL